MAFKHCPDCRIPESEVRCEAMTKPVQTFQDWRRASHRCIRTAKLSRAGRSVCALHGALPEVKFWNGEPDSFTGRYRK